MPAGQGSATALRHAVALEALDPRPGERVLEVGCGRGALAELLCARLAGGAYVGLDRSPTAVVAAARRVQSSVAGGTAGFVTCALADVDADLGPFDAVVAVDVNAFWAAAPVGELAALARVLRADGRLVLVHEPPDGARVPRIEAAVVGHLTAAGWRPVARIHAGAATSHGPPRAGVAPATGPGRASGTVVLVVTGRRPDAPPTT